MKTTTFACMVCHDVSHFNQMVASVRNKTLHISSFLSRNCIESEFLQWMRTSKPHISLLEYDKQHPHFLCGNCMNVNMQELRSAEEELKEELYRFLFVYDSGKLTAEEQSRLKYEILRLLQGEYPLTYRQIEQYAFKKKETS